MKTIPLVEAIFELHWESNGAEGRETYDFLLGPFRNNICKKFPVSENIQPKTPGLQIEGAFPYYRFRTAEGKWPVVQLGPGILTVNATKEYKWDEFNSLVKEIMTLLLQSFPSDRTLTPTNIALRYINNISLNSQGGDMLDFLSKNLNLTISLPSKLFSGNKITSKPEIANQSYVFQVSNPDAQLYINFIKVISNTDSLHWELSIISSKKQLPKLPDQFANWIEAAHATIDLAFCAFIEGNHKLNQ